MKYPITQTAFLLLNLLLLSACSHVDSKSEHVQNSSSKNIRIATFNVSMEANNYVEQGASQQALSTALSDALATGEHQQIKNIAEIIQTVRPDVLLLNEFDYLENTDMGITAFQQNYLNISQQGLAPIDYAYAYLAPVNTGVKTPLHDESSRLTHFGFGKYPGQYGMVVLSQFPIKVDEIRTFQHFLWKDMPNNLMPLDANGKNWYNQAETNIFRLSSKSHWDLPISICDSQLHVLASHPTPPVFDGAEDRNGRRNHDEIRFWKDYINAEKSSYHYDDNGLKGGMVEQNAFVILGDLNASPVEGDAHKNAISQLLNHPKVNNNFTPKSLGGALNKPNNPNAASHTASWGMRADYVIPSSDLTVIDSGVFWPAPNDQNAYLVSSRSASSDHRLVWVEVNLPNVSLDCL